MLSGGFSRKLDAHQIQLYRDDWYIIVEKDRYGRTNEDQMPSDSPQITYLQLTENNEDSRYSFSAEYPKLTIADVDTATEVNQLISAFVVRKLQGFRVEAISTLEEKQAAWRENPTFVARSWDDMNIGFKVTLLNEHFLVFEMDIYSYHAGAAHPNTHTETFNFLLKPVVSLLDISDLFDCDAKYLEVISDYCIEELTSGDNSAHQYIVDDWVKRGAGPEASNFKKMLIRRAGIEIIFDPYQVACYAEGRKTVFVPKTVFANHIKSSFIRLLP